MRMARFVPTPMDGLVDDLARYELGESTCPALSLADVTGLTGTDPAALAALSLGYRTTRGDEELRALIAGHLGIGAGDVLVTPGGIAAMFLLALVSCEPGDRVVLATPCFPPARSVPEALRAEVVPVPLDFAAGYRLDVDAVAAAVTPRTRLVSLASPQNPSGVRLGEPELRTLVERVAAVAPEAVLLVDETYRETGYGDAPGRASVAALSDRVVTCASLSKSHGVPGLRVGWLTATDPELYERLRVAKFNTLVCCSAPDEALAVGVLRHAEAILRPRRRLLAGTLDELRRLATRLGELVEFLPPDGGALCCLRLRPDRYDEQAVRRFYARLHELETRVAPGSWFGESDRVFRVGFGHLPVGEFTEALRRLESAATEAAAVGDVAPDGLRSMAR
jgi:aspartate/methionine/tyrosine aminotransferase